jgi:pimeloyl-ACP methyl ester carboxylesterase
MTRPRSGWVNRRLRLHYLEWCAEESPASGNEPDRDSHASDGQRADCIILVHGNSANAWWWRWTVEAMLPGSTRIIALDLRGHGESEWMTRPAYTPFEYADDIADLIDSLRADRPLVAGHSMGGIASLAFARRFPALARGVAAIDVAITSTLRRDRYLRHLKALPTVVYPDLATAKAKFRLMPREGVIAPEILAEIAEKSVEPTPSGGYTMKFDRESFFGSDGLDAADAIRRIEIPLLLVRAGRSRIMTAEAASRAVMSNPAARLVTIPDAYHHLPLERPTELAREILSFARELRGAMPMRSN